MKNFKSTLLAALLLVCSVGVFAQQEKYSKVRFYPTDKQQRLEGIGLLEIDHFVENKGGVVSTVAAKLLKKLVAKGIRYEVLVDDVVENIHRQNLAFDELRAKGIDPNAESKVAFEQSGKTVEQIIQRPAAFTVWPAANMGGYYRLNQMYDAINNLVAAYPTLAQRISLGNSLEGRPIYAVKISDNVTTDESEPEILYVAQQHAREAIGGSSMIFFMQYLCQFYATDNKVRDLVNNREIFIIVCANPDGWERNRRTNATGGGQQRKNRRKNTGTDSANAGVDLNRNWGVDWGNCPGADNTSNSCGTSVAAGGTHYGTAAFSEPETQAMRTFVQSRYFVGMIDQHAFGPYYSLPFGRPSLHTMEATTDAKYFVQIPAAMGKYNGMRAGNSPQAVGYEVAGGVKDWMLMGNIGTGTKGKIYGLTGEGGAADDDFWPAAASIEKLCKGMVFQNIQFAFSCGSYVDIQDVGGMSITNKWGGNMEFKVTRLGLANAPVTVSMVPIENVVSVGAPVVINSLPSYEQTHNATIAYTLPWTIQNGHRIRFAWRVSTAGYTYDDTVVKFLNPTELLSDNLESGTGNWTFGGGFGITNSVSYQGANSLAESPTGGYTDNNNRTAQFNTTMNLLNSTQTYLTFYTRYRSENFYDKLQVQMSVNGGAWNPVAGTGTVQETGTWDGSTINGQPSLTGWKTLWTKQVYDLSAGNGSTNVRFRFQFTSSGASSFFYNTDDGFYLDNIQVITSTRPLQVLPVRFLDVRGRLLPNRTAEITWDAETDELHSYFEVEKSADGSNFKAIGKVTTVGSPYKFIDNAPFNGNNYYRIKQYDKDGQVNYSVVINVKNNAHQGGVSVYPNPLSEGDVLTIRHESNVKQAVNLRITDAQGRIVHQQFIHDWSTAKNIKINTNSWPPQVYVLKITNSTGELITIEKILKK